MLLFIDHHAGQLVTSLSFPFHVFLHYLQVLLLLFKKDAFWGLYSPTSLQPVIWSIVITNWILDTRPTVLTNYDFLGSNYLHLPGWGTWLPKIKPFTLAIGKQWQRRCGVLYAMWQNLQCLTCVRLDQCPVWTLFSIWRLFLFYASARYNTCYI